MTKKTDKALELSNLANSHKTLNNAEFEKVFDVSEELVDSVIDVTKQMLQLLEH